MGNGLGNTEKHPHARSRQRLASDDLRDALVAHLEHPGNLGHRQAFAIGGPYRLVAIRSQLLGPLLKLALQPRVFVGECRQAGFGLRCLAFASSDRRIVGSIPATRLA
jgi:hypothetical protein